jgi:hypothetical protein
MGFKTFSDTRPSSAACSRRTQFAQNYPERPVRIVVPYLAGGGVHTPAPTRSPCVKPCASSTSMNFAAVPA